MGDKELDGALQNNRTSGRITLKRFKWITICYRFAKNTGRSK